MKYINNLRLLLLLFVVSLGSNSFAQGIRKNYLEMTSTEKDDYVTAVQHLYDDQSYMAQQAIFHALNAVEIHRNITFLPWHREFTREFEQELQQVNPYLSVPYWDWRTDRVKEEPLFWSNDFLNLGNIFPPNVPDPAGSSLSRDLQDSESFLLPTTPEIDAVLENSDFQNFAGGPGSLNSPDLGQLENRHNGPHGWVGGTMETHYSPFDPVFYLHHSMIDKLWADWEDMPGHTSFFASGTSPSSTDLAGYPGLNSNDLIDTRALGIFYAENQLAELESYTVSNDNLQSEKFAYQYEIQAGNNFLIPSDGDAEFRSCNVIRLLPGFEATDGSAFRASIDNNCELSTSALVADNSGGDEVDDSDSVFEKTSEDVKVSVRSYPNPFNTQAIIEFTLAEDIPVTLWVSDVKGRQVASLLNNKQYTAGTHQITFDGALYPAGMYYYTIQAGEYYGTQKMILAK